MSVQHVVMFMKEIQHQKDVQYVVFGPEKFTEVKEGEREWAAEHVVGVAQGVSEDILADLRANFEGECSEVGMYFRNGKSCP